MLVFNLNNIYKLSLFRQHEKGFSLVELMITLALLSIVLALGYSFYFFGTNAFGIGERQVDVQQNARLVGEFIAKEVRIAESITIYDDFDSFKSDTDYDPSEGFFIYEFEDRIYFDSLNGSDKDIKEVDGTEMFESITGNVELNVNFDSVNQDNMLQYSVEAKDLDSGRSFQFDTEVLILNLKTITDKSNGNGKFLFFQVPAPPDMTIRNVMLSKHLFSASQIVYSENSETELIIDVYTTGVVDSVNIEVDIFRQENLNEIKLNSFNRVEELQNNMATIHYDINSLYGDNGIINYYYVYDNGEGKDVDAVDYFVEVKFEDIPEVAQRRYFTVHDENINSTDSQ